MGKSYWNFCKISYDLDVWLNKDASFREAQETLHYVAKDNSWWTRIYDIDITTYLGLKSINVSW